MRIGSAHITLLAGAVAVGSCSSEGSSTAFRMPTAPSSAPTAAPPTAGPPTGPSGLIVFRESGTGFATSDLRDVQDDIVQFSTAGELIWAADGTRLSGYRVVSHNFTPEGPVYFIEGAICPEGCAFEVRFGSKDGERRAYLTVDYGHDNPGTLVDVEIRGGALVVSRTSVYPPGLFTLSGHVTEMTPAGPVPIEGAIVYRAAVGGWQGARTDRSGFYEIGGLFSASRSVETQKTGYVTDKRTVIVNADTRLDITLVAQP